MNTTSLPLEFVHIFEYEKATGHKLATKWELENIYTVKDVYDFLEYIDIANELDKERERLARLNQG